MKQLNGYYNRAQLKERSWTVSLIMDFLGEHDKEYGSGNWNGRLKRVTGFLYYGVNRVHAAEALPEFIEAKATAEARRARRKTPRREPLQALQPRKTSE
jgi:hypothetical protein